MRVAGREPALAQTPERGGVLASECLQASSLFSHYVFTHAPTSYRPSRVRPSVSLPWPPASWHGRGRCPSSDGTWKLPFHDRQTSAHPWSMRVSPPGPARPAIGARTVGSRGTDHFRWLCVIPGRLAAHANGPYRCTRITLSRLTGRIMPAGRALPRRIAGSARARWPEPQVPPKPRATRSPVPWGGCEKDGREGEGGDAIVVMPARRGLCAPPDRGCISTDLAMGSPVKPARVG